MKTIIVVIPVGYGNSRKVCNLIENEVFETHSDLRDVLNSELGINKDDDNQPQLFNLSDFMKECNDQVFDFEGSFISYVNFKD